MLKFEKGTVVLSLDDGAKNAFRTFQEILLPYSIPATFNISTSYICPDSEPNGPYITRGELLEMSKSPYVEIAGHGHKHDNTIPDITTSRELLREWLDMHGLIGFASPGSGMTKSYVLENTALLHDIGYLYIRSAGTEEQPNQRILAIREKAERSGYTPFAIQKCGEFVWEYDSKFVNSVVILHDHSLEELKQLTDLAIEEKACVVLMFHNVRKPGEEKYDNLWSFDYDTFEAYIKYLSEKQNLGVLEVLTNKDAFLKGSSR